MKLMVCTAAAVAALAIGASSGASANDELMVMQNNPSLWVMPNGNYSSTRYSTLSQINKENVGNLQPAWTFSTGVLRGHEGGPLVIGDVMYIVTPFPNIVYALDLNDDGRVIWKYEPKQDPSVIAAMCCDTVNRGAVYGDGKIVFAQADSTVVALDAATGEVVWQVKNADPGQGRGDDLGAADLQGQGLRRRLRRRVGRAGLPGRLQPERRQAGVEGLLGRPRRQTLMDPEKTTHLGKPVGKDSGTATWEGDQWKLGGGTTWGWYSVDPELNLIYYGTGNPGTWNPVQRPGDNRWSMTIFARDADTGMAKWVYQMTPHDEWDYDGVNEMILADIPVKGRDDQGAGPLRPQRLRLHPGPRDRRPSGRREVRPGGELGDARRHGDRAAAGGVALLDPGQRRGRQHHQHLPGGARHQGPAAGGIQPEERPVLRADQPRLHGLRAVPGVLHRRSALRRRHRRHVPGSRAARISATSSPGMPARARSSGPSPSSSRSGRALWPPPATSCSTARSRAT